MTDDQISYTNSSTSTARLCMRKYQLQYPFKLELIGGQTNQEALDVGSCWHAAHEAAALSVIVSRGKTATSPLVSHPDDNSAYAAIDLHTPSPLWAEKLRRLFAAHRWYWEKDNAELETLQAEETFRAEINGRTYEGQRDARVRTKDGRVGVFETKTTSESIDIGSPYWDKLRMDTQVGIYARTMEKRPDFIIYDVTRKPTIQPARITKKELARMEAEYASGSRVTYFGEELEGSVLLDAFATAKEPIPMYGARLTADIGNRPGFYFARREIPRTTADYESLEDDLDAQVRILEYASFAGLYPRNPDACSKFGKCQFFSLCSNNIYPVKGEAPDGYRIREHLHPELQ